MNLLVHATAGRGSNPMNGFAPRARVHKQEKPAGLWIPSKLSYMYTKNQLNQNRTETELTRTTVPTINNQQDSWAPRKSKSPCGFPRILHNKTTYRPLWLVTRRTWDLGRWQWLVLKACAQGCLWVATPLAFRGLRSHPNFDVSFSTYCENRLSGEY